MRNLLLFFLFAIFLCLKLGAQINWEPVDIPNDSEVRDIVRAPNGGLFACFLGIYRSNDDGKSWEPVNKYEEDGQAYDFKEKNKVIIRLAVAGNGFLFAFNEDFNGSKLFRSEDNGESWNKISLTIASACPVYIDNKDRIYTQSDSNLVYSDDYGDSWEIIPGLMPNITVHSITEDKYGGLWLGGTRSVLYKHKDSTGFVIYTQGLEQYYSVTSILFVNDSILASTDEGLICSINRGISWKPYQTEMNGKEINGLVHRPDGTIFCLTAYDGIYRSDDNCANWTLLDKTFLHRWCNKLIISADNYYLASQGVYKSTDKGISWGKINNGLSKSEYRFIHFDKQANKYYLLTSGGFYYSNDDLKSWTEVISDILDPLLINTIHINDDGEIFMGKLKIRHLYQSTDGGSNWQAILNRVQPLKIYETSTGGMYMIGDTTESGAGSPVYGLYYSEGDGNYWDRILLFKYNIHFRNTGWNDWFYIYTDDEIPDDLRVLGFNPKGYLCLGAHVSLPDSASFMRNIIYINGTFYINDYSTGFWKSYDHGDSFVQRNEGITKSGNGFMSWDLKIIKDHFFLSTPTGLYLSTDQGESWNETGPEPIGISASELYLLDDGRLYYSNTKGNFRSDPVYLSVKENVEQAFDRLEVTPNPSDGEFSLKFKSTNDGDCSLNIYTLEGKKVYEEDFSYNRIGENEIHLKNLGLSAGCYILELRFGEGSVKELIHIY